MWLRLLILFLALWLVVGLLRKFLARGTDTGTGTGSLPRMVRCDYCGVFHPETESIVSDHHYYCCKQHATAAGK